MGKFFKGEFGHIVLAVKPTGFRRHLCLFRLIPYLLGDDLIFEFVFRKKQNNVWWSEAEITVSCEGKEDKFNFPIGAPDIKGEWRTLKRVCHPTSVTITSGKLALKSSSGVTVGGLTATSISGRIVFEDVRVISKTSALAWLIGVVLGISAVVMGLLNLLNRGSG